MSENGVEPHAATWCVHFNGIQNKVCKVGIRYDDVKDVSKRHPAAWPCILSENATTTCAQLRKPTPEEIALDKKLTDERIRQFLEMEARKPKRNAFDLVECQLCQDRPTMHPTRFEAHVKDEHSIDPASLTSKFKSHSDGTAYFDNDDEVFHGETLVGLHWLRLERDPESRALWEAE